MNDNSPDILELLSRASDEPMSDGERRALAAAIHQDPTLAAERAAYERLQRLIADQAAPVDQVDWEQFAGDVSAEIRLEVVSAGVSASEGLRNDPAIRALSTPMPNIDWRAFHDGVARSVREVAFQRQRTSKWPAGLSWFAPFAAAALIAIVVWRPFGLNWLGGGGANGPGGPVASVVVVEMAEPQRSGRIEIAFDRSPQTEALPGDTMTAGGTVIVNGVWPPAAAEVPTVQWETYFY